MATLRFGGLLLVVVFAQLAGAPWLEVGGVGPDFLFLLVVHLSLAAPFERIYVHQWTIGVAKDLFGSGDAGLFASLYLLAGIVLSRFRSEFFSDHRATQVVLTLVACFQVQVLAVVVLCLRHPHVGFPRLFWQAGGIALYTAAVAPIAFGVLRLAQPGSRR